MSAYMMYGDQRHTQGVGHGLGKADPHQYRPDQARGIGDRHRVNVLFRHTGLAQCLIGQTGNGLHMLTGRDLRHHAAVERVHIRLGKDGVAEHRASVTDDSYRGFIARGFKSQDIHCASSSSPNTRVRISASSFGRS